MHTRRLTRVAELVNLWPFFAEKLTYVRLCLRFNLPIICYRRILQNQIRDPRAWVAVAFNGDDGDFSTPLAFGCAHECTPLFFKQREYEVSIFYHETARHDATIALQTSFESWCRSEGIVRYYVPTRRDAPSGFRCFQHPRYGLKHAFTVFKKELK